MDNKDNPKVFISYSWSSSEKVLELAERLMSNGVEVILDKWDLKEGQDKYAFMEQSVNDSTVNKVLIICDKAYTEKANQREGGVGDETLIISPEVYNKVKQEKFIPIIFETDSDGKPFCPTYIKSRIHIDLSTDNNYEVNYEALLRNIHNKPLYRKPALGAVPEWLDNEKSDLSPIRDLIKQICGYNGNEIKADFLIRKSIDEFSKAIRSFNSEDIHEDNEVIFKQIDESKLLRDLYIEFLEVVVYSGLRIEIIVTDFFEKIYNDTQDTSEKNSYYKYLDFEFFEFFIWEIFICTTAILLYYERYSELHKILTHTYFLKHHNSHSGAESDCFVSFINHFYTIETIFRNKKNVSDFPNSVGEILIKREKKPIITKNSIANADLLLYHMSFIFKFKEEGWEKMYRRYWFPNLYCYSRDKLEIWQKLKSKSHCEKILPLLGVTSVDKLKEKITNCIFDKDVRYNNSSYRASIISDSIKFDEIATRS